MASPTRAAAHIITADAHSLGEPEILIIASDDEGQGGATVLRRVVIPADATPADALDLVPEWTAVGHPTYVETGYVIFDVERSV